MPRDYDDADKQDRVDPEDLRSLGAPLPVADVKVLLGHGASATDPRHDKNNEEEQKLTADDEALDVGAAMNELAAPVPAESAAWNRGDV